MASSSIPNAITSPSSGRGVLSTEDKLYRKVIYRIVPLFFIGYVILYLDRVNIGFAKLQMASEFGLSDASFGIGASIFFWGYMLFEIPSNLVMHRVGARVWIGRIMVTWGIVSMLMVFSPTRPYFICYGSCWVSVRRASCPV